jgi:DNA-binding transcriptional ArsR family regulator
VDPESRRADDILRLLADGTPRSEVEIKTALGGNQTTTANALRTLRDDRIVELEGEGRRNSPFIYRLARPP